VRFLSALKSELEARLERLGRLQWLAEELAQLEDVSAITMEPENAWLRVKGLRALDPARTRLARGLAAWRERRAVDRNRPRGWILDDSVVREIVMRVPRTVEALAAIPEMPAGVMKHSADDLLECIRRAEVPDPPPPLDSRQRPDPAKAALVRRLGTLNQAISAELGLSPEVLATRRDLEQLADGRRDVALLKGWRKAVVGERMLAAL
jgi:ribonuclease D